MDGWWQWMVELSDSTEDTSITTQSISTTSSAGPEMMGQRGLGIWTVCTCTCVSFILCFDMTQVNNF